MVADFEIDGPLLVADIKINMNETSENSSCVVAKIRDETPFGEGGNEMRIGSKHFKPGAKVYIVGWYPGMCMTVTLLLMACAGGAGRETGKPLSGGPGAAVSAATDAGARPGGSSDNPPAPASAPMAPAKGASRDTAGARTNAGEPVAPVAAVEIESGTPCPRLPLDVPEAPVDRPMVYTRGMWLADSLATTDLVVAGSIRRDGKAPRLAVTEILCGGVHPPFNTPAGVLTLDYRMPDDSAAGVWMLARTPRGYVSLNPDPGPMPRAEWDRLTDRARPAPPAPALRLYETPSQLFRYYERDGKEVRYGVEVSFVSEVFFHLWAEGERVMGRAFTRERLERVWRRPPTGRGFSLQWYHGGGLWRGDHWLDGELHGMFQSYYGTGKPRETVRWERGRRHGWTRSYDEDGRLEYSARYDRGLIVPVIRYKGPPGPAELHFTHDGGIYYSAPDELIHRIRVGMTARQVSDLLRLDVSLKMGVRFSNWRCDEALIVRFEKRRVAKISHLPNGSHCE